MSLSGRTMWTRRFCVPVCLVLCVAFAGCQRHIHCVAAGTQVGTPHGPTAIEVLRPGDEVLSQDAEGGITAGRVTSVHAGMARDWLDIRFADGSSLTVTDRHLVATAGGFVEARDLRPGAVLRGGQGDKAIASIRSRSGRARAFDLSVSPDQTYFAEGVLVHNKSVMPWPFAEDIIGRWASVSRHSRRPSKVFEFEEAGGRLIYTTYSRGEFDILVYRIDEWSIDGYAIYIEASLLYAPEWYTSDEAWMDQIRSRTLVAVYKSGVLELEGEMLRRIDWLENLISDAAEMAEMADGVAVEGAEPVGD